MKKIKLLPMKITRYVESFLDKGSNVYCFDKIEEPFEVRFLGTTQALYIGKDLIYRGYLKTPACKLFGGTPGHVLEKDAFDIPTKDSDCVFCFEPRVSMHSALVLWIRHEHASPRDIDEVMNPLPSFEEATVFLKRNGIFNENHIFEIHETGAYSTRDLKFIPEDIKKRIERVLDRKQKERLEEEQD